MIPVRGKVRKVDVDWKSLGCRVFEAKERSNQRKRTVERKDLKVGDVVWVFDGKKKIWMGPSRVEEVEGDGRVVKVARYGRVSEDVVKRMD